MRLELRERDLNPRPPDNESGELPNCSTPLYYTEEYLISYAGFGLELFTGPETNLLLCDCRNHTELSFHHGALGDTPAIFFS